MQGKQTLDMDQGGGRMTAQRILDQMQASPDALIRANEVEGSQPVAASRALARMAERGLIQRVGKGLYYLPRTTLLGRSKPPATALAQRLYEGRLRPTRATAANLLGLTTQVPARTDWILFGSNLPRAFPEMRIHLRRGASDHGLTHVEGALLEVFRDGGAYVDQDPGSALDRCLHHVRQLMDAGRTGVLCEAAQSEPPRARAILGALLEVGGASVKFWQPLRAGLSPLSRFEFGVFAELPNAKEWQAK